MIHEQTGVSIPGVEPQPRAEFHVKIALEPGFDTPDQVKDAIVVAINEYGAGHKGTVTPFAQQPGVLFGYIHDERDHKVGEWWVTP